MADQTPPPGLETKDLPYAPVPASVPLPDRIGYEQVEESEESEPVSKATRTGKPAADKTK